MYLNLFNSEAIAIMQELYNLSANKNEAIKVLINNDIGFEDLNDYFGVTDGEFDEVMDEIYYDTLRDEIEFVLGRDRDRAYNRKLDFEDMVTNEFTYRGGDMCDIDEDLLDECIKDCYIESVR